MSALRWLVNLVRDLVARSRNFCAACDGAFLEGDWVVRTESGKYVHSDCA